MLVVTFVNWVVAKKIVVVYTAAVVGEEVIRSCVVTGVGNLGC